MNFSQLTSPSDKISRSISAENFTGEKGGGGRSTGGTGSSPARNLGQGWKISPSITIPANTSFTLAEIKGSGSITHIWLTVLHQSLRRNIIRIYWDDCKVPAVEVPVGDFFATGLKTIGQIDSACITVNPKCALNSWWSMPFNSNCRIEFENTLEEEMILYYQIDYTLEPKPRDILYFHAAFNRSNPLPYKEEYVILPRIAGKGCYVGTYMTWGVNNSGWWGEGEIKMYLDDDVEFPTICGTGTEDYFLGSYNFEHFDKETYQEYSTLYSGLPVIERPDGVYKSQMRFSMYRWHIQDPIYFSTNLAITMQALGWKQATVNTEKREYLPLQDDISSVAFWYMDDPGKDVLPLPALSLLEIN